MTDPRGVGDPSTASGGYTFGVAVATLASGIVVGGILAVAALAATGLDTTSLGGTVVAFLALWAGFAAVPVALGLAGRRDALIADLAPVVRPSDALWLPLGIAMQFLVAIPYVAWDALTGGTTRERVGDAAEDLTSRAGGLGPSFWLLAVLIVVGAPLVEELVFRCGLQGALLRAFERRPGGWERAAVPVAVSSLVFAAFHAQGLQFPALALVGLVMGLVHLRHRRLGPTLFVHVGFNLIAVIQLAARLDGSA